MGDPVLLYLIVILSASVAILAVIVVWLSLRYAMRRTPAPSAVTAPEPPASEPTPVVDPQLEYRLTTLPYDLSVAAYAGALPRWFDADVLAAIAPELRDRIAAIYSDLQHLSFVEAAPDARYCIHAPIRVKMLARTWRDDPVRYRAQATRAARYFFVAQLADRSLSSQVLRAMRHWLYRFVLPHADRSDLQIEWLYHLSIADPASAAAALKQLATKWTTADRFADVDALLAALQEHVSAGRIEGHLRATVHYFKARADWRAARVHDALDALELARHEAGDDHELMDGILAAIGEAHQALNQSDAASRRYDEAWAAYRVWLDRAGGAKRQWVIWDDVPALVRRDDTLKQHQEMLKLYHTSHNLLGEAHTARVIGDEYTLLDQRDDALKWYEDALKLYRQAGSHVDEATTLKAIGDVYHFLKHSTEALEQYDAALGQYRLVKARLGEANTLKAKGDVLQFLKRHAAALDQYDEALAIYHTEGAHLSEASTLAAMGNVLRFSGRGDEALRRYAEALRLYQLHNDQSGEASTRLIMGDYWQASGQTDQAIEQYETALTLFRTSKDRLGEGNALKAIGDAQLAADRAEAARQHYAEALELYRAVGARPGEALTRRAMGEERAKHTDPAAALEHFMAALALFEQIGDEINQAELQARIAQLKTQPASDRVIE